MMEQEAKPLGMSRAAKKKRRKSSVGGQDEESRKVQKTVEGSETKKQKERGMKVNKIDAVTKASAAETAATSEFSDDYLQAQLEDNKLTIPRILNKKEIEDVTSSQRAALIMAYLLDPIKRSEFYANYWQKKPIHVNRSKEGYFKNVFSRKSLESILSKQLLIEGVDIDPAPSAASAESVASEEQEGDQKDEDQKGAVISEVWKSFAEGAQIRLLAPQKYHECLWKLASSLEHEFSAMVGCHSILSPSSLEEQAETAMAKAVPRYESTDSFILQLEGSTTWHLVEPSESNKLPRFQTYTATPSDLKDASKERSRMQLVLSAGDSLYIPKGWLYQQHSSETSLHVRLFTNQSNSMADLLELLMPQALQQTILDEPAVRVPLPRDYRSFLGVACSENDEDSRREEFQNHLETLLQSVVKNAVNMLDPSADQMTKTFIHERLPVPLSQDGAFFVLRSCLCR